MLATQDVLSDPAWLPHQYDPAQDRVLFLHIPQEVRAKLTFLAEHKPSGQSDACWVAGDELRGAPIDAVPVHFIFHSAFCRSTLLVKALNAVEGIAGLSEPMIVNSLQGAANDPRAASLAAPLMRLLGRPNGGEKAVVVKPSNFANGIIPALLNHDQGSKAVIIYGTLKDFLRSVAKKGLQGRIWGRKQLRHNQQIIPLNLGMDERALYELTDMQAAGLSWLLHMRQFAQLLEDRPSQFRTIEANSFNERKAESILGASKFFGQNTGIKEAEAVANGDLFTSHAKLGGDYEAIVSKQDSAASGQIIDEEIDQVTQWVEIIMKQLNLSLPLKQPLLA